MLLCSSRHSRLVSAVSEVTGTHTLVHRLLQRQFSTAPVCKSNKGVETIKSQIRKLNDSPHHTADYKYRNSKRLFAVLDAQIHHNGVMALHVKHKNIERDLEQPEVRQRFKGGLPDTVLTRVAINYCELRIGFEKSLDMVWVVFKLTMLSHLNDVPILLRLIHIVRVIVLQINGRWLIWRLRRLEEAYAPWLS